nr:isocitrate lyase/phosphoenolpyruvate mutase family protein [Streptomyces sp. HNM0574]
MHHGRAAGDPLVLPGPWDAASARSFVRAGFPALATPSQGIALALGYEDGETPAEEMFAAVARIVAAVDVPVTADVEDGYGLPPRELVARLREAGAVGCNLEDSARGAGRVDAGRQAAWLAAVREAAGDGLFVNARIDSYLRPPPPGSPGPLADAVERARRYAAAGADCVYPIKAPPEDLRAIADAVDVPVNALCAPERSPADLGRAGAARVTFGGALAFRTLATVDDLAHELRTR